VIPTADDSLEITFHEVRDDVYVVKIHRVRGGSHDIEDGDDVLVAVEVSKQFQLPKDSFRVDEVGKRVLDFFNGDHAIRDGVVGTGDYSIASVANGFELGVALIDGERVVSNLDIVIAHTHFSRLPISLPTMQ